MSEDEGRSSSDVASYGAEDGPVSLWHKDAPLPVYIDLDGREVALVDRAEYRSLVALRDAVASAVSKKLKASKAPVKRNHRLTRLDKDAEVRRFIAERLGTDDVDRIRQAAIKLFGAARVPSRSAVNRFAMEARSALESVRA